MNELKNSITYLLTELSPSWETANCAATQELPSILRNPKVHHRVHKSPPLVPILSQIDPVHTTPSYLTKIYFNIVRPPTSWSSYLFLSFWLPHQYSTCIPHLPHSCYMPCSSHSPWLDHSNYVWQWVQVMKHLIIQIMFGNEYKLWSSSLCTFLKSPVTSSLFGPNILLSTLFSDSLSLLQLKVKKRIEK
jgi:hypothetical protein